MKYGGQNTASPLDGQYLLRDDCIYGGLICGKVLKSFSRAEQEDMLMVEFEQSHIEILSESIVQQLVVAGADRPWSR